MSASIRHSCCFPYFAILISIIETSAFAQEDLILSATTQVLGGTHTYRNVEITEGSVLRVDRNMSALYLYCHSFVMDASSKIDGSGESWTWPQPGTPQPPALHTGGNGGSYGGHGGASEVTRQGKTYGSQHGLDISFGSSGIFGDSVSTQNGGMVNGGLAGTGGAAVLIMAATAFVEGRVLMDGLPGENSQECNPRDPCITPPTAGGGGSGGGILIAANQMIIGPSATLSAYGGNGGLGGSYGVGGHAGGGGRVKIFYETGILDASAVISATAGRDDVIPNPFPAEDGTVWIQQVSSIDRLLNPSGDLNNDGIVDERDLILLMKQWHQVEP